MNGISALAPARPRIGAYFDTLHATLCAAEASDGTGAALALDAFYARALEMIAEMRIGDGKLIFVGNGGSASIASHMAIDFTKNAAIPAVCFNDGAALTCLGNDLGYDNVFAKAIAVHGRADDVLVAISSSGNSENIVRAVRAARSIGAGVIAISGFAPDNRLRRLGDLNLYLPSAEYGFVEIGHLAACHALIDFVMGWSPEHGLWSGPCKQTGDAA